VKKTYDRMKRGRRAIDEKSFSPLFIGRSHDLDYGQYLSYQKIEKAGQSHLTVDAKFEYGGEWSATDHIHKILFYIA